MRKGHDLTKVFSLFLVVFGLWTLTMGTLWSMEAIRATTWPATKGRILVSSGQKIQPLYKGGTGPIYFKIEYLYMVNNRVYEGHRVGVGWPCPISEKAIKNLLEQYPQGSCVYVKYDPARPEISLLKTGPDEAVFLFLGLGLISLSVSWPILRGLQFN